MQGQLRVSKLISVVLAVVLMVVSVPVAAAQVQDFEPDFYESALTGYTIEVTGPNYEINDAELQQYLSGEGEIVHIGSDTLATNIEVSFFDDTDTPQQTIDIYLQSMENAADSLQEIDSGTIGEMHYAMAEIEFEGIDIVYLVLVEEDVQGNVDLLQALLGTPDTMVADLEAAQAEIAIAGAPYMAEIDPATLSEVALGTGTLGDADTATPVAEAATHTFPESDVTVGIGKDFAFAGDPEERSDAEAVRIQGPDTFSMIAIGETGASPEEAIVSFSNGIISTNSNTELVEEEMGDDSAWRLLMISSGPNELTYMLITVDLSTAPGFELLQAHEVPANSAAGSLIVIQQQITINGEPVLQEIDIEQIASLTTGDGNDGTTQASETPEATNEPDENGDSRIGDPRSDARLPEPDEDPTGDVPDEGGNTSETGGSIDPTPEATEEPTSDADAPGTLTDSSWEGGVNGSLVEWDADLWFVDSDQEGDLVSEETYQEDTIVLTQQTTVGISLLYVSVYGAISVTPGDYLEQWRSDEYLTVFTDSGAEAEIVDYRTVNGNTSIIFHVTSKDGIEFIVIRQAVTMEDGSILLVTLDAPAEEMPDIYQSAQDVTIDGESVMRVFSPSQIERAIGD